MVDKVVSAASKVPFWTVSSFSFEAKATRFPVLKSSTTVRVYPDEAR